MTDLRAMSERLLIIANECRHRAIDGCTGIFEDGVCSDPEADRHPEEWCSRCLMGVVVQAVDAALEGGLDAALASSAQAAND